MLKNKWISQGVALLAVVLLGMCSNVKAVRVLGQQIADRIYFADTRKVDNKIKIITIDEESESVYGNYEEWERSHAAELVKALNQPGLEPAVIGFDINYASDREPEGDAAFVKAVQEAGNVVVATRVLFDTRSELQQDGSYRINTYHVAGYEYPYSAMKEVCEYGFSNTLPSAMDGSIRQGLVSVTDGRETMYSFSYQVYAKYAQAQGKSPYVPKVDDAGFYGIRYMGRPGEYETYSWASVVKGEVDMRVFKDSVVLVGAYMPGMRDDYPVPIGQGAKMFGVEIHANIIDSLNREYSYGLASLTAVKWINIVLCVLFFLLLQKTNVLLNILSAAVLVVGYTIVCKELYERGNYVYPFGFMMCIAIILVMHIVLKYVTEWLSKRRIMKEFRKYIAPQVLEEMNKNGELTIKLGGESRDVAVLFVDIRGFTTLSEALSPEQVVEMLNEYLALTTECIFANGGMLDKFIGDATMAVFNAPVDLEDYEAKAVQAALDIVHGAAKVNERIKEKIGREVAFGVGVNCGPAVVGNIGCETRMDYTAIGDTVNTAARLEGKALGGQVVISENLRKRLEGRIITEPLGEMELKGKSEPLAVHAVLGFVQGTGTSCADVGEGNRPEYDAGVGRITEDNKEA